MCRSPAARRDVRTVSSIEAFVVPHVVEIAPATEGLVTRVLVRDREVVNRGQALVEIAHGGEQSIVRSWAPGVVSRCRVHVGDEVAPWRRLLSIVRADDVLVVARFETSAKASLQKGKPASVRIPHAAGQPVAARLVCVAGPRCWAPPSARLEDAVVRVVARLEAAPPAALSLGIDAIVDVECAE